jgi:DNA-binding GntR family transcriptional regulator
VSLVTFGERVDTEALARTTAMALRRNADAPGSAEWLQLDQALMDYAIFRAPNRHLVELIRQNQLPIAAASRALTKLGLPEDSIAAEEYLTLFDLILERAIEAAATYWRSHLATVAEKNIERLKLVAVIIDPPLDAPYLIARGLA